MSTPHVIEELSAYLDGMLTADEHERVETHLQTCDTCREEREALEQTLSLIHTLPEIKPPENFVESVRTRIDLEDKDGKVIHWTRSPALRIGVAACAVAVLSVYGLRNNMYTPESTPEESSENPAVEPAPPALDDQDRSAPDFTPAPPEESEEKSRNDLKRGAKNEQATPIVVGEKRDVVKESQIVPTDAGNISSEIMDAPAPSALPAPGKTPSVAQALPDQQAGSVAASAAPPGVPKSKLVQAEQPAAPPTRSRESAKSRQELANAPAAFSQGRIEAKDAKKDSPKSFAPGESITPDLALIPAPSEGAAAPSSVPPPTVKDVDIAMPTVTLYTSQAKKVHERVRKYLVQEKDEQKKTNDKGKSHTDSTSEGQLPAELKLSVPQAQLTALITDLQKHGKLLIPPTFFANRSEGDPVTLFLTIKAK